MLDSARELWSDLDPAFDHCNHGSFGAVARRVREHQDELRRLAERNPNQWFRYEVPARVEAARIAMASFVGAAPENTIWAKNATTAVNVALSAVPMERGAEILLTDHVYGAVWRTAERIARRHGGTTVVAPVDLTDDVTRVVDGVMSVVTDRTSVAIVDHIASPTGLVLPIDAVVAALRDRGIVTIVDAAHAPGSVPVDVATLGADFWTGNFHKWCAAPRPCAALVVADEWRTRTEPLVASFGLELGFPTSFAWQGTDDYTSLLCLDEALGLLASFGWAEVRTHDDALAAQAAQLVGAALGVEPALPAGGRGPMSLLELPPGIATDDDAARAFIKDVSDTLHVEVSANPWRGRGWLRLSAFVYNDVSDYERLAEGLPGLLKEMTARGATSR